ncbi:unnamed protein product [Allacma fusca]|uniref:Uncharacterized protein n=1 Tax=Allacma fusca TaxID=39272 RepID=A0A8J2PKF2_9HEXA|nr:unnamed protein product [Allacma fusca]
MRNFAAKYGFLLLFLCQNLIVSSKMFDAVDDDEPETEKEKCEGEQVVGLMSVMRNFEVCKKEEFYIENYKSDSTRYIAQRCFAKCIFKQEKALDESGALTLDSFKNALKNRITGKLEEVILKAFVNCYEQHSALLNPDDPTCPGFDKVGICLHPVFQHVCDGPEFLPEPSQLPEPSKQEL